jgi:hypothetical protein
VGQLDADAFDWQGGSMAFQLGVDDAASDHVALAGNLVKQGSGPFQFNFRDGAAPPSPGTTYTLITFAGQNGFSPTDFTYAYGGNAAGLNGEFELGPTALRFTVISTPVELQSFGVD